MLSEKAIFATIMQVRRHPLWPSHCQRGWRTAGRRAQRSLVWGLAFVVALLLAGRVSSVAHMALTRHVQCVHGELIHAAYDQSPRSVTSAQPDAHDVAVDNARVSVASHEHCDATAVVDAVVEQGRPVIAAQLISWQLLSRTVGPAVRQQAIAILSLAPKSSPPRA